MSITITTQMLKIFDLLPEQRNSKAILKLSVLFKDIAFFQKLQQERGDSTLFQCIKYLKLEIRADGDIICRKGEPGRTFYILLQGNVDIYITSNSEILDNPNPDIRLQGLVKVNTLGPGQTFGELALLNDAPRMATIVGQQACTFATLNKHDYMIVLASFELQQKTAKLQELGRVHGFSQLSARALQMLLYVCQIRSYVFRELVVQEGDLYDNNMMVYVVRRGDFRVLLKSPNRMNRMNRAREVCNLSTSEIFGEMEVLLQCNRVFSVQCVSAEGTVYCIKRMEQQLFLIIVSFIKVFTTTGESSTLQYIKESAINKYEFLKTQANINADRLIETKIFMNQSPELRQRRIQSNKKSQRLSSNQQPIPYSIYDQKKLILNRLSQASSQWEFDHPKPVINQTKIKSQPIQEIQSSLLQQQHKIFLEKKVHYRHKSMKESLISLNSYSNESNVVPLPKKSQSTQNQSAFLINNSIIFESLPTFPNENKTSLLTKTVKFQINKVIILKKSKMNLIRNITQSSFNIESKIN